MDHGKSYSLDLWERIVAHVSAGGSRPSAARQFGVSDDTPTPSLALQLYCAIAQDWADNVIAGRDLSDSYPIEVAPTKEHAEMLLGRVDFIRRELIPLAEPSPGGRPGDK